ncbi:hypothetical protein FLONG3_1882 [Fusarium longipes]|uniref:Glucan 4-alpha-glucosidase n=1 Tax=Fusarium longipes TaxID=694270 RepID=A0A395T5F2_9HYPO|nr:hypothetical protein FLONG3_1882 [Fusarium longipes]
MEDPWGSPWTNDSPPKIDLPAPPPNAHFTADHSGSSQRVSPSLPPWNDDDDTWGGWAEAGKDSSPRWGRSPGLRPIGGSPSGSRLPSPTPDPWGRSPTFDNTHLKKDDNGDSAISLGDGLRPIIERVATRSPSPVRSLKENAADIWQQPDPAISNRSVSPLPGEDEGRPSSPDGAPRPALQPETRQPPSRQPSNKVSELVEMFDDISKRTHSASPIDPSMRKLSGNISPVGDITSELEPNGSQEPEHLQMGNDPEIELEDGSKTQEGSESNLPEPVANQSESESEPEPEEKAEVTPEELPEHETEVAEDKTKELPKEEGDQAESDSWSDFESPTQDACQMKVQEPEPEAPKAQLPVTETSTEEETSTEKAPVRPKPPSEPFSIDMTKLDDIFPSVDTSFPPPEPVPDVIIDDTFTSISERKAWYLMSRPGSIRKHNMGDDENYVRVGWGNSHVREQSIRIVRRWMEEDSITGRVILGRRGGAAGAKIFNWDSSAPATEISISELLARKNHSRQTSVASKGTVASPTAAAFGWSNAPIPSPTAAAPPSAPRTSNISEPESASTAESLPIQATKTSPVSKLRPPPLKSPPKPRIIEEPPSPIKPIPLEPTNRPVSITQPLPFPSSPTISEPQSPIHSASLLLTNRPVSVSHAPTSPLAQPPTNAGWGDDEDDDDWGDMVSSPTVATNGGFASMNAIVGADKAEDKENTGKPLIAGQSPMVESFEYEPEAFTKPNGRISMDTLEVPSQDFTPNNSQVAGSKWSIPRSLSAASGHSRSTTIDLITSSVKVPVSGHSRSTTIDLGTPHSPLNGLVSTNLISSKVNSPIDQTSKVNTWDSWGLGLIDDSNKPVSPEKDNVFANQTPQTLTTPLDTIKDNSTPKKPRPMSLPVPPRPKSITESPVDEGVVANILRDLPDLSYMLR